ncbi:MAG TPA: hypothetical protein VFO65_13680, partial [Acidimicrobiales bacterium]|nr:hypothetical protein [Acidimicrobiales bacterium]
MALAAVVAGLAVPAAPSVPAAAALPPPGSACPMFPADNVWHADVTGLAVHPRSDAWITAMGGPTRRLHPDFGPAGAGEQPYGIPYTVVPGSTPRVTVAFDYGDESDPGPYPFTASTPVEGGSDRHALMVDGDACVLYELFAATYDPAGPTAGSGAVWDLRSNALRPPTWTSADAAGLPILPGLVRRDEVVAGEIDHAIRLTASRTDRSFVWPARHQAGAASDPDLPPMGAWFRLRGDFDLSRFRADTRVVLRAMQPHGLILADNGSNWHFTGASEEGWDTAMLDELKSVPAGQFEAVDASPLMVHPDSGQARAAGAPATTAPATAPTTAPPAPATTARPAAPATTARPAATPATAAPAATAPVPTTGAAAEPVPTTAPPATTTTA